MIRQQQVAEDRSLLEVETAVFGSVDIAAREVRRQQVRCELDAMKICFQAGVSAPSGSVPPSPVRLASVVDRCDRRPSGFFMARWVRKQNSPAQG